MDVTAVVVNWNGGEALRTCLEAFLAQDHPDLEVTVVDNASTDGSPRLLEHIAADEKRVEVLWEMTNRGFAGAVNDALAATTADVVVVANFDVRPRPDYVRHAVAALEGHPRRGAIQGKLLRMQPAGDGRSVIDTTGHLAFRTRLFRNRGEGEIDRGQWDEPGPVFGVSGALAVYRRAMLEDVAIRVGPRWEVFDEDLFAFWEDVDLDWRAAMRGWHAWYEPAAVAEHERGGAGPRRTAHVEQLNFQNRLLTIVKNDDASLFLRDVPGVLLTTILKAGELLLTVPSAFLRALFALRLVRTMLAKRRVIRASARVTSAEVVNAWFERFDYGEWVRTWWRRVRST